MHQTSDSLSFEEALNLLRRRLPLIVLSALVVAGAAFLFSKSQPKQYTATASIVFENNPLSAQVAGLPPQTSNLLLQQASNVELVRLGDMAAKTAGLLGHGLTEQEVQSSLTINGLGESSAVDVVATATSPVRAAAIANTYVRQFVKEQQSSNHQYFANALGLVQRQIAALPLGQRFGPAAVALQNRAQNLRFLSELRYGNVRVAQQAVVPKSPSSPNTSTNTILGLVVGLILGLGAALLLGRLDGNRLVKEPKDLEAVYGRPLLGVVPRSASLARSRREGRLLALEPAETEAFNQIRARLRAFNPSRETRVVLVTSGAQGEGASTVTHHLAEAAARSGSRTLLIEADLRHPTLGSQVAADGYGGPGISELLRGEVLLQEATKSIELTASSAAQAPGHTLDLLASVTTHPPNPGQLIQSRAMADLIEQAKSIYDLVVIDAPPLLAISDAFPLLRHVDGVVVVAWVGRSRRDVAEELREAFKASAAAVLGVVANGVDAATLGSRPYTFDHPRLEQGVPGLGSTNGGSPSAGELVSPSKKT